MLTGLSPKEQWVILLSTMSVTVFGLLATGFTLRTWFLWLTLFGVLLGTAVSFGWKACLVTIVLYALGLFTYALATRRWRERAGHITPTEAATCVIIIAILVALILPAVQSSGPHIGPRCRENLHRVGEALGAYHDDHGCFPAAVTTDAMGRPMHSWTVFLLPYLGEQTLYDAYNFQQAHDAPANYTVTTMAVSQFQCPYHERGNGVRTDYGMVVCPGSISGTDRYVRLRDITDGPFKTLIIAEMARDACAWPAPRATIDPARGINSSATAAGGATSVHPKGAFFLFSNGYVRYLTDETTPKTLRALCTMAGDEVVSEDDY
jgi:uncharacterized protein DUF1559